MKDINIERNSIKNNSVFVLMHYDDDEVLSYDVSNNEQIILNENLIPWDYNNNFIEYDCRYVCDETIESMARTAAKQLKMQLDINCLKNIPFLDNKYREECECRCRNINVWSEEVNKYV